MQTIMPDRAETRSIAIAAPPGAVLDVVGDARRLPEWAPEFAVAVRRDRGDDDDSNGDDDSSNGDDDSSNGDDDSSNDDDGSSYDDSSNDDDDGSDDGWIVDNGTAEFPVRLRVDAKLGTVDILRRGEPPRGAFARVIPNGEGSEFMFSLVFPADTDAAAVDAQMATVEAELRAVRGLVEAPTPGRASD